MGQAPGGGAGSLHIAAQLHKVLPGELARGHLGRQGRGILHGPAVVDQHLLVVVDHAHGQVEGHGIGRAVHGEGVERAVHEGVGVQVGDVQQHADGSHGGHVADGEDIRAVAVLVGEDQVLGVLVPVDADIVGLELDLQILAFGGIALVQALAGGDDGVGDGHEVIVMGDLQGDGFRAGRCAQGQRQHHREDQGNELGAGFHGLRPPPYSVARHTGPRQTYS